MAITLIQKKLRSVLSLAGFVCGFCFLAWVGYKQFYSIKSTKPVNVPALLNNKLPLVDPGKDMNKLEIYQQVEKDSIARMQQGSYDPYAKQVIAKVNKETGSHNSNEKNSEQRISRRLNRMYASYTKQPETPQSYIPLPKWEKPKESVRERDTVLSQPVDPQMKQLETMLDKLIDIQHPDLVKQRNHKVDTIQSIRFASIAKNGTVQAVVHQTQTVTAGSTIKLRLLQELDIGTSKIPKGNFIYGICAVNSERLIIKLTNACFNNQVIPVSLNVYDIDGIEGIYIPGTIINEVSKEGADQAISSFNPGSLETSLGTQAVSAGIQTAKTLLSRKVKLIRVTVKAGHHILLQNVHSY